MNDLIYEINSDLKIRKVEDEEDTFYKARIVYSAMSFWIRVSTLESLNDKGVSSKHITSRCSKVLGDIIESYPEIKDWFFMDKSNVNYPIIKIRKRLINSSEIKYIAFKNQLKVSKYEELKIKEGKLIRGYCKNKGLTISGVGYFKDIRSMSEKDIDSALKFYYIDKIPGKEKFINKVKSIKWELRTKNDIEVFNSKKEVYYLMPLKIIVIYLREKSAYIDEKIIPIIMVL